LRSDARRQFKDEYSKKLDLELDVSKGRLGMHGKGFFIVVNGDVD
jgi:peroxiredoxin